MSKLRGLILSDKTSITISGDKVYVGSIVGSGVKLEHIYENGVLLSHIDSIVGFRDFNVVKSEFINYVTANVEQFESKGYAIADYKPTSIILKAILKNFNELLKTDIVLEASANTLSVKTSSYEIALVGGIAYTGNKSLGSIKTIKAVESLLFKGTPEGLKV